MDDSTLTLIRADVLDLIAAVGNPMQEDIWGCGPISEFDVLRCPDPSLGRLSAGLTPEFADTHEYNTARIAWLIEHHDYDAPDSEPITIAPFDPFGSWPVLDGNHRLSAAYLAGIQEITVSALGDIWW